MKMIYDEKCSSIPVINVSGKKNDAIIESMRFTLEVYNQNLIRSYKSESKEGNRGI